MRKLLSSFPVLVNEWHPSKNGDLKPEDFAKSSKRKIWWLCSKGHEWEATIGNRTGRKSGCPVCAGKKASADRNLEVDCPEVAKEWHPSKNSDSKPSDLTVGSKKKVWWQCSKGHEWEAAISNRTGNKSGCPFCNGRQLVNFPEAYPEVAAQWHPVRNGGCKPEDFTHASSKKVWWLCPEGHEWESQIANRTKTDKPTGCPICLGRKQEDLAVTNSKVAAQWHPSKNGESKPEDFTAGSSKKVWWLCSIGHEWKSVVKNRTKKK
ncbi:MAG: zinc-ribbon domain-containing protein, partial [Pirellulales bacterium]|nr:zinc-ribbon domain-containing protein [Pirellulales bacterium]